MYDQGSAATAERGASLIQHRAQRIHTGSWLDDIQATAITSLAKDVGLVILLTSPAWLTFLLLREDT